MKTVFFFVGVLLFVPAALSAEPCSNIQLNATAEQKVKDGADATAGMLDGTKTIGYFDKVQSDILASTGDSKTFYFRYCGGKQASPCGNISTTVVVICDKGAADATLKLLSPPDSSSATYTFALSTSATCDVSKSSVTVSSSTVPTTTASNAATSSSTTTASAGKSSHMGFFSGLLLFLLALGLGYCVIGFLYKRFVLGARGPQQLPNYLFWLQVGRTVQDFFSSNRTSSRYTTASSNDSQSFRRYNPEDETGGLTMENELKYDQPPLNVRGVPSPNAHHSQPLTTAASTTPNVNRRQQQQQQQELLLPNDDSDERLLQV